MNDQAKTKAQLIEELAALRRRIGELETLEAEHQLTFAFKHHDNRFIFEYNDDGKGIPPENLAKIFDPLFHHQTRAGRQRLGAAHYLQFGDAEIGRYHSLRERGWAGNKICD
jgi:nitrogen-specific signal transduction histidine kinase